MIDYIQMNLKNGHSEIPTELMFHNKHNKCKHFNFDLGKRN